MRAKKTFAAPRNPTDQGDRLGMWLVLVCSSVVVVTAWAVVPAAHLQHAYLVTATAATGAVVLRHLRDGSPLRPLVYPLILMAELTALGLFGAAAGQPYLSMIPLAFIYLGLTCPPHRSWLLLPFATTAWLFAYGVPLNGPDAVLAIRLPIGMAVWVLIAELLARFVARVREHTAALADDAETDVLTGLPNRRALPRLLAEARPGDALVMVDVDHFREVNEQRGHSGGDDVLRALGAVVRENVSGADRAVRYGGEEVLLLLSGVAEPASCDVLLRRLRKDWERRDLGVTFSAGGVVLLEGEPAAAALRTADALLYEAKAAGRARWHLRGIVGPGAPVAGPSLVPAGRLPLGEDLEPISVARP